jgi:hypothetical protein
MPRNNTGHFYESKTVLLTPQLLISVKERLNGW